MESIAMSTPIQTPKSMGIHEDLNTHQNDVGLMGNFELDETLNRKPNPRPEQTADEGNNGDETEERRNGAQGVEVSSRTNDVVQKLNTEGDVSVTPEPRLSYGRRKKGKGKGKSNAKKELAVKQKYRSLLLGLNPVPFIPNKILDFSKREMLMRKLGLWDFVRVDFDRNIRADFIAQLVATYEPKYRASYVDGFRIMVNRADLGRALKLSVKKEKADVDLEWEASPDDCVWLIEQFLFDWMILHEDAWPTPNELLNWLDLIRDGHPEKVEWASLIWIMVEKELALGSELKSCYYASHLQLLIKSQREELFLKKDYGPETEELEMGSNVEEEECDEEEKQGEANYTEVSYVGDANEEGKEGEGVDAEEVVKGNMEVCASELTFATVEVDFLRKENIHEAVELYEESKEEKHDKVSDAEVNCGRDVNEEGKQGEGVNDEGDIKEGKEEEENRLIGGPNTELNLGQDGKEEEEKEVEMMYTEKYEEDNVEEVSENDRGQGQWLLHGKNDLGEHFMHRCDNGGEFGGNFEDVKGADDDDDDDTDDDEEEDEEEEEEDVGDGPLHVFPNDYSLGGNGLVGNLLQTIEGNQIAFGSQQQLHPSSSMEIHQMSSAPSFLNHSDKRAISHDSDIPHHELHGRSNKKIRIDDPLVNGPMDFVTCMHQIQQMAEKARIMYEEKDHVIQETSTNQRILIGEVEKRDAIINRLHTMRMEEVQRKDAEIYRLNRELRLMESVLDGYRNALKGTQKAFDEYRKKAQLKEEPVYRDAWPGGLMLSTADIEAFQKEYEAKCLCIEHQVGVAEAYFVEKLSLLDGQLRGVEAEAKELLQLNMTRKNKKAEAEKMSIADEDGPPTLQAEEEAALNSIADQGEGELLGAS